MINSQQLSQTLQQMQNGGGQPIQQALSTLTGGQPLQSDGVTQLFNQLLAQAKSTRAKDASNAAPVEANLHPLMLKNQHPVVAQAARQAISHGANPTLLNQIMQTVGHNGFVGLCEAFVEQMTQGKEGIYPSATAAWNAQQDRANTDMSKIKPGDTVYFSDPSQPNGHVGIWNGNGKFTSATFNGIKQTNLNDWTKATHQQVLGFVPQGQDVVQHRNQLYPQQPQAQRQVPNTPLGVKV